MDDVIEEKRARGNRRWGMEVDFPLRDCNGLIVVTDRRRLADRRLGNTTLEERMVMLSGLMPREDI